MIDKQYYKAVIEELVPSVEHAYLLSAYIKEMQIELESIDDQRNIIEYLNFWERSLTDYLIKPIDDFLLTEGQMEYNLSEGQVRTFLDVKARMLYFLNVRI